MNKKYGIPYNPTLLFLGMFLGYNCEWYNSIFFEAAIKRVSHINAHGILQIFIPVMVFEAAFNMDWYIFKKQISQIGILAFPCVLINAIIM
jgi:NhaP-type Na+/H+ or K+/H+ antiporter